MIRKSYKNHILGTKPLIMGVVNVTPDSFSDGGEFINKNKAVERAHQMMQQGAHIIDIGGESTRPGAEVVDIQQEIDRVCSVIEEVQKFAKHISIDTRNAETMRAALRCGATSINDISGLTYDSQSIEVAKSFDGALYLMHSQGTPQTMQDNPAYDNVTKEIVSDLTRIVSKCAEYGIDKSRLVIDPGIGFGKTLEHNLLLLGNIKEFHGLGVPILLGTSRKSFIAALSQGGKDEPAQDRLGGSLASALWGLSQGVQIFRVHDVKETAQAFAVYEAIAAKADS